MKLRIQIIVFFTINIAAVLLASCVGGPGVLADYSQKPVTLQDACLLIDNKDQNVQFEGLAILAEIISTGENSAEATKLWFQKGEAVLSALEKELLYEVPMHIEKEVILYNKLSALKSFVYDRTEKGGFIVKRFWLVGDSTMADYSRPSNPNKKFNPMTGWGEMFQQHFTPENLSLLKDYLQADSVIVINRGMGGRSTRTYWNEGSWKKVFTRLHEGDFVLVQFGHNDSSEGYPDRYIDISGYKKYLEMYVNDIRSKQAVPILCTSVNRNYPWSGEHKLANVHGGYPDAMKEVAGKMNVQLIDMTRRSLDFFSEKGKPYVTSHYFMVFGPDKYPEAFKTGSDDNTHFQPEGAEAVALLAWEGLLELAGIK
ncbi:MAG: rhamnogalacturonan acetylesterase [Spirochaetales bacterium]|nr:rhamnogalacturonan acetylesterase [Spirochaetales bacterium]